YVQLAHAVGARASRQLGALRVLTSRHEDQLLTLLKIWQAHAGMLRLGPGARRELLDGRQRNHLAADLREALRAALNRDEPIRVDRHDVAGVVPARAALGRRRLND